VRFLFNDNGKPVERQGRKAKGHNAQAIAAWLPKGEFFMIKIIASITVLMLLAICCFNSYAADSLIDSSKANDGVVGVAYSGQEGIRYKVMVTKGSEQYYYDYFGSGIEYYPLQFGNGEYKVSILENVSGTKYRIVYSKTINVNMASESAVYLQSVQNVNWTRDMKAIVKASELSEGLSDTRDKVNAIYRYIINNIGYDYNKIDKLDSWYVPDIEQIYADNKGICYDYSSLFASMLRSQGIPAKLVKGYTKNVNGYHAWNEVLIGDEWITVDTTYDAIMRGYGEQPQMEKNKSDYETVRVY